MESLAGQSKNWRILSSREGNQWLLCAGYGNLEPSAAVIFILDRLVVKCVIVIPKNIPIGRLIDSLSMRAEMSRYQIKVLRTLKIHKDPILSLKKIKPLLSLDQSPTADASVDNLYLLKWAIARKEHLDDDSLLLALGIDIKTNMLEE